MIRTELRKGRKFKPVYRNLCDAETLPNVEFTIRILNAGDGRALRQLRLEALREEGHFFSPSEDERARSIYKWRRCAAENGNHYWIGIFAENGELAAVTTVSGRDKNTFVVGASIIARKYRDRFKLAPIMYGTRVKCISEHPIIKHFFVFHREGNSPSKGANTKAGFRFSHCEMMTWGERRGGVARQRDIGRWYQKIRVRQATAKAQPR
jgi:hypothetical protein